MKHKRPAAARFVFDGAVPPDPTTEEEFSRDIRRELSIDDDDLNNELRDQPQVLFTYAMLKEQAHAQMKRAKYEEHKTREKLYVKLRSGAEKKMTETELKMYIHRQPEMLRAIELYMDWRDRYRMLCELVEAFKERGRCLQTLSANKRQEWDSTK